MTGSFGWAWRAARRVRAAGLGRQAISTVRPRGVLGVVRSRAPLSVLLYVAARDGLVVEQCDGGFALLQPPAGQSPARGGGYRHRVLRWFDRRWDLVVLAGPPLAALALALASVGFADARGPAVVLALAAMLWVSALFACMMAVQLRWIAGLGARHGTVGSRAAQSLPAYHWSVPLLHQPDPTRVDGLIRRLTERLVEQVHADLQERAGDIARIKRPDVTETLVVLTRGISTQDTRTTVGTSIRAVGQLPPDADVIVLQSPARLERAPKRAIAGGSFLVLYGVGLALTIAVCAVFVADAEAQACRPDLCDGHPASYPSALRWLLQRLLIQDPTGLSPGTAAVVVLGWLVSVAAVIGVLVAIVAGRQELARNKETAATHDAALTRIANTARVLILVVTGGERDAVLASVRERTGREAVLDYHGDRTIYSLGPIDGTEVMLAQAGEQGTGSAAGMLVTAATVVEQCRPDYVILTGICYGLRPDEGQRLGDVVVARRVQNIDHRKVTVRDGTTRAIARGVNVGCSPELLDRVLAAQTTWSTDAHVHVGTLLSSNTVVDSVEFVQRLRDDFPEAIAGEMEGVAVHEAASHGSKPDWTIIKAISDWGHAKTDDWQPQAARNAADFVTQVIAAGGLNRRRPGGPS